MTITDPFAPPAPEEAQQPAPAQAPISSPWDPEPKKAIGELTVDVKPNFVGFPQSDGKVVLTFKGGSGYDSPWIVVHANDLDEALRYVTEDATKVIDLMTRVQQAGKHFAGLAPAGSPSQSAPQRSNAPQGAAEAPIWAPEKPHYDFVYKSGVSVKNGKTWHAWMPPEKSDSRDPKFFYPPN
jgi:hypothetical protein